MMTFDKIKLQNFEIPAFSLKRNEIVRMNFDKLETYKEMIVENRYSSIVNVYKWGVNKINKKTKVIDFLKELNFNEEEVNKFDTLDISLNSKIITLSIPYQNIVFLKGALQMKFTFILIETGGMHIDNLKTTYKLLSYYLKSGGGCVEITYPPMRDKEISCLRKTEFKVISIRTT